ncbi:hypothetical protein AQ912_15365 [Burkholderia pseudomallei]|nr:hypothetical protein AQ912_15365 [Burkholderia pseudomallei]
MPRQPGARARDEQRHGGLRETASASQGPERFGNTSVDYVPRAACRVPRAACRVPRAACRVPRAACRVPRAACRVPRAACRVPRVSGLRGCGAAGLRALRASGS